MLLVIGAMIKSDMNAFAIAGLGLACFSTVSVLLKLRQAGD